MERRPSKEPEYNSRFDGFRINRSRPTWHWEPTMNASSIRRRIEAARTKLHDAEQVEVNDVLQLIDRLFKEAETGHG
jgi:hypothetical protein